MTATADYPLTHPDRIPAIRYTDHGRWTLLDAPDHVTVETHTLMSWSKRAAAVLVCPGQCNAWHRICRGHAPRTPLPGEHLVIGAKPGDRAVYRVAQFQPGTASVVLARIA